MYAAMWIIIAVLLGWDLLLTACFLIVAVGLGRVKQVQDQHLSITQATTTIMNVNFKTVMASVKALGEAMKLHLGQDSDIQLMEVDVDPPPSGSMKN